MEQHHFKPGDLVAVYNSSFDRKPRLEGFAKIIKPTDIGYQYEVDFGDGEGTFTRFVYPGECQDDPKGYLHKAIEEWLETMD